jgi:hypothetical protein
MALRAAATAPTSPRVEPLMMTSIVLRVFAI